MRQIKKTQKQGIDNPANYKKNWKIMVKDISIIKSETCHIVFHLLV